MPNANEQPARSKSMKWKKTPVSPEIKAAIHYNLQDRCKAEFIIWAEGTWLDITGIWEGEPVYRPAICAWEAWKAAWSMRSAS